MLPYDDPRPSIYPHNPLNPYKDLESRGEFLQERVEKHIELYHELINSGASYEAANKLIDLLTDFYIKDWRAREREWILAEEIRELIKTDPLHQKLKEFEDAVLGRTGYPRPTHKVGRRCSLKFDQQSILKPYGWLGCFVCLTMKGDRYEWD